MVHAEPNYPKTFRTTSRDNLAWPSLKFTTMMRVFCMGGYGFQHAQKVEALHSVLSRDPKSEAAFHDDTGYPRPGTGDRLPTTTLLLPRRSALAQKH